MWHIRPQHVLELNDMRGRRHVLQIKLTDSVDVRKDPGKLPGHRLDLLLRQTQPGKLRHMKYLLPLDHARDSRATSRGEVTEEGAATADSTEVVAEEAGSRTQEAEREAGEAGLRHVPHPKDDLPHRRR